MPRLGVGVSGRRDPAEGGAGEQGKVEHEAWSLGSALSLSEPSPAALPWGADDCSLPATVLRATLTAQSPAPAPALELDPKQGAVLC